MSHRRIRWLTLVPVATMSTMALVAAKRPAVSISGCTAVSQWVAAHESELPKTYAEIIRYPTAYRKIIQSKLAWPVRRDMWLTQLKLYSESAVLSPEQRAFVSSAAGPFREMLGDQTTQSRRETISDSLNAIAGKVLGRDLHHAIFFVLGPEDPSTQANSRGVAETGRQPQFFLAALRNPAKVPAIFETNCTCHQLVTGPECTAAECIESTPSCTVSQGCGTGGVYSCNGVCNKAN
jgi:hypothetical protein